MGKVNFSQGVCSPKMVIYQCYIILYVTIALNISSANAFGQGETKVSPDGTSGTLSFKPPDLNDEEAQSQHMPAQFKCEGCQALAYQFTATFKKLTSQYKSKKGNLPESVVIEAVEALCRQKFDNYGIKEVRGTKHLSGPGLPHAETPGIMQGGGKWPARFMQMCDTFIGEISEEEIYDHYVKKHDLVDVLCRGAGELSSCAKLKKEKLAPKKKKSKKDEF